MVDVCDGDGGCTRNVALELSGQQPENVRESLYYTIKAFLA